MTRDETKKLLLLISATYPQFKVADPTLTIDAWLLNLAPYNFEDAIMSFRAYNATSNSAFAPSVGQIIAGINKHMEPESNELEAWGMVYRAICDSAYHAEERFNALPPTIQKAVGTHDNLREWGQTDVKNMTVVQSNFMRVYRSVCERVEEEKKLPADLRAALEKKRVELLEEKK